MKDDTISRQFLIEAFKEEFFGMYSDDFNYMIKWFEGLPTAEITLEQVTEYCRPRCLTIVADEFFLRNDADQEIVRCRDCRWWRSPDGCLHWDGMVNSKANGFCSYGERKSDG